MLLWLNFQEDQLVRNTGQILMESQRLDFLKKKNLKDIKTYSPKKISQHRGINHNKKKRKR